MPTPPRRLLLAFYPAIPASDGTSMTAPVNAPFEVFELSDTSFSNPLALQSTAGLNAAPLVTTAQGVLPPVNVMSPNFSHIFKSGEWQWRRDSFEGAQEATEAAAADAARSAAAAEEAARLAQAPTNREVDEGINRANLPGMIADGVASQPTVAMAAAAAVGHAARTVDIITGADKRAAVPLEAGTGWAHPFTDAAGRIVGGFTTDGVWRLAQAVDAPEVIRARSSRTQVACIGDSLVYGYPSQSETWPAHLSRMFPDVTFTNAGYSGATTDEIRFRIGALPLYAEIPGGIIPATANESVPAIVKQKFGMGYGHEGAYYGTLAGVRGNLKVDPTGTQWRFEPAFNSPAPTIVTGKHELVREDFYPHHTALFWMGRNDVSFKATGFEGDVVKHVVASIQGAIDHLRVNEKQFGVASIVNMSREVRGNQNYDTITRINTALAERFPSNFIDIRKYLVTDAIYDAGLTPTAEDLKAMAEDAPPPQIMDGGSHPLPFMVQHVARKFAAFLEEKAYI